MRRDHEVNRRDVLKTIGVATGASFLGCAPAVAEGEELPISIGAPIEIDHVRPERPLTCVIIGAGNRGNVYASYAHRHPEEWKVVGVAEPIPYRNERMARGYGIPDEHRFVTWEHVFERPRFADVAVITTPDHLHYGPAIAALGLG